MPKTVYPTLNQRLAVAEKELSRTLIALSQSVAERPVGAVDDDLLRFLEAQLPNLVGACVRLRALRDASLSVSQ